MTFTKADIERHKWQFKNAIEKTGNTKTSFDFNYEPNSNTIILIRGLY